MPDSQPPTNTLPDPRALEQPTLAAPNPPSGPLPGPVPGYDLLGEIGRGGMGVVYKALHLQLNRLCALKTVLAGSHAGPVELLRFRQEAETVARLQHPNIVQIYEVGVHAGHSYLALEYMEGGSLAQKTAGLPQPPRDAARLLEVLARAVEHAHQHGIIHRDLTPGNVLLAPDGVPKLSDFGLARRISDTDGITATGAIIGTPGYLSPEQASTSEVSRLTDVYGLGAILYFLLTGRPPFHAATPLDTVLQTVAEDPVRPSLLCPGVPRDLETICLKCLHKEPPRRYATAADLAADLGRFLAGEPILARPASVPERSWRWCRRNPVVASLAALVAALLVVLAAGATVAAVSLAKERDAALLAERARGRELFRATLNEVRARRASGQQGQRIQSLEVIRHLMTTLPRDRLTPEDIAELRDEAIACFGLPDVRETAPARPNHAFTYQGVDTDRSLDVYAWEDPATGDSMVRRWSDPGPPVRLESPPATLSTRSRALSPDGRWLAEILLDETLEDNSRFRVWDWAARQRMFEVKLHAARRPPSFHPDGDRLAVVDRTTTIHVLDSRTGKERDRSPARFRAHEAVYSPDGRSLVVVNAGMPVEVVDPLTWRTIATFDCRDAQAAAWHPGGRELALGNAFGQVFLCDLDARSMRLLDTAHLGAIVSLHYLHGGQYLISSADDNRSFLRGPALRGVILKWQGKVLRSAANGRHLAVLHHDKLHGYELTDSLGTTQREHPGWAWEVEFDPLGRWLAVSSGHGVDLCSVDTLAPDFNLKLDSAGRPAFRPDGSELVTYGLFSHVLRWPLSPPPAGGRVKLGPPSRALPPGNPLVEAGLLEAPQHECRHAAWSSDGRVLAWCDNRNHRLYVAEGTPPRARILATRRAITASVNADGTLVVASVRDQGVEVLRVSDGQTVHRIPEVGNAVFSPDGRWLISSSPLAFRVWRTDTWQTRHVIPRDDVSVHHAPIAFRKDSRLVALPLSPRRIALINPETGVALASLTHSEPTRVLSLAFHPAGDRLAGARNGQNAIVWNLASLHRELGELGLAWDVEDTPFLASLPNSPPVLVDRGAALPAPGQWYNKYLTLATGEALAGRYADAVDNCANALSPPGPETPGEVARVLAMRGGYHWMNNSLDLARDDWRRALDLAPDLVEPTEGLTRLMVLGPSRLRDPHQGLRLALANVKRAPEKRPNQLVLAAAYVGNGRHKDALAVLDRIPPERREPLDGFLRAIALHHLGRPKEAASELAAARAEHDRLSAGLEPYLERELRRTRHEAEEVVNKTPAPLK